MRIRTSRALSAAAGMALAILPAAAGCAQEVELAPVISRHRISVDGTSLDYTAEAGRLPIRDVVTGQPHAYMFYTAYRIATKGKPRPVTYIWGGGPGQAALPMDFTLAGPKRVIWAGGRPAMLVDNPDTLLTDTDLVFIDQIGTGYSRVTDRQYVAEFSGTIGDTDSFTEFVRTWRIRHHAEQTAVIVGGASWGAPRAGTVAYSLLRKGVPVRGAFLVSGETQINALPIPIEQFKALRVVGMSTVAFRWKKLSSDLGGDLDRIHAEARTWALQTYAPALRRIGDLSNDERAEIARGLGRYTGIRPALIDHATLEIPPPEFRSKLLIDEGKTLNGADTRSAEPLTEPPSRELSLKYLRDELGYTTDLPHIDGADTLQEGYAPLRDYAAAPWDYATSPVTAAERKASPIPPWGGPPLIGKPLPSTAEAMALDPNLQVLVTISRYDGASTCEANEAVHAALPPVMRAAMTVRCYDSGHSIRLTPGISAEFRKDVRMLLRQIG